MFITCSNCRLSVNSSYRAYVNIHMRNMVGHLKLNTYCVLRYIGLNGCDDMEINKKLNTKEISKRLQSELQDIGYNNVTISDAKEIMYAVLRVFRDCIVNKSFLLLNDFGKFEVVDYTYNNPKGKTREKTKLVKFTASTSMKNEIKERFCIK